jgi:hypothetical protein
MSPIPIKIVKKGKNRFIAMRDIDSGEVVGSRGPTHQIEEVPIAKKGEFWGIKKSMWKKIAIVAISLYIGWSWAKISDQAKIIKLQQKVLTADSSTAENPS